MNKTKNTLPEEAVAELSKLFNLKKTRDGFFLTYYNGHVREFCKFVAYLIRQYYPKFDTQYANAKRFTATALIKRHGKQEFGLFDMYDGEWCSGDTYYFTMTPGLGALGEDVLYIRVRSEQDDINEAMDKIYKVIKGVSDIWGMDRLSVRLKNQLTD